MICDRCGENRPLDLCGPCYGELAAKVADLEAIVSQIRAVAETGILPDGDHVITPTKMWMEELLGRKHHRRLEAEVERLRVENGRLTVALVAALEAAKTAD